MPEGAGPGRPGPRSPRGRTCPHSTGYQWLLSPLRLNERFLAQVGYTVRFDDVTSEDTRIKFLTDGMLLREAISDSLLRKYSCVVLDEAHERTVHTDVLFGVVKAAQKRRKELGKLPLKVGVARAWGQACVPSWAWRLCPPASSRGGTGLTGCPRDCGGSPDRPGAALPSRASSRLQVIVMSATMDVDLFSQYFNGAPVLYLEGRQHPIQVFYTKEPQQDYLHAALVSVFQIHQVQAGCECPRRPGSPRRRGRTRP